MTVPKIFALLAAVFGLCFVFDVICTKWGMRLAWFIIIICLAYLSVP